MGGLRKIKKEPREDANREDSHEPGIVGIFEGALRKFRKSMMGVAILVAFAGVAALMGCSLMLSILIVTKAFSWTEHSTLIFRLFIEGTSLALAYMAFGFSMIVVIPLANRLVVPFVKPFRGPAYSASSVGWFLHNTLTYAVRYTFLDWITPTPFNLFFFRQMGMKIGHKVEINSSNVSDPCLITLEDGVTIGGSASLLAHYAMDGYLVIAPVIIRKRATIGMRAIVMGGVDIGEYAKVLPNSVVLPKTVIPAGETWGGVPAIKIIRD